MTLVPHEQAQQTMKKHSFAWTVALASVALASSLASGAASAYEEGTVSDGGR